MTKAQFKSKVLKYQSLKLEMEAIKEEIESYMVENSTSDEVVKAFPHDKELAVTYSDGYVQSRLDTKKAKQMFEEMGIKAPIQEVTVTKRLEIKIRNVKK